MKSKLKQVFFFLKAFLLNITLKSQIFQKNDSNSILYVLSQNVKFLFYPTPNTPTECLCFSIMNLMRIKEIYED